MDLNWPTLIMFFEIIVGMPLWIMWMAVEIRSGLKYLREGPGPRIPPPVTKQDCREMAEVVIESMAERMDDRGKKLSPAIAKWLVNLLDGLLLDLLMFGERSMGAPRLQHDHAWAAAAVILDLVKHLMREECHRDAHTAFYEAIIACLQRYDQAMRMEAARLCKPSRN